MLLNDLTILTHTHTDCETLWGPYFDSYEKYFNHNNHLVLINKITDKIKQKQIIYSDTTKFSNRLIDVLKIVKTKYVTFGFEDMFLYDFVNVSEIERVISVMSSNEKILFTRLIKSGIVSNIPYCDKLFLTSNNDHLFSITPTIWKNSDLIPLLENLKNLNIWDLERQGDFLFKENQIKGLYYFNNERNRGGHFDSSIYPHICSAIFKGKWNISEYSDILLPIISKYNINIHERGIF